MGSNKTTNQSSNNSTYQATATPMENQLNQTLSNNLSQTLPQAGQTQQDYLKLLDQGAGMFSGQTKLNGSPLAMAIGGVTPEQQNSIVQQSLRYLDPQFQQGGYLNSGAAASIQSRTAADLLGQSAQFNVTNAGNVLSGLLAGNTNAQNSTNQQAGLLSNNLQGLRQITQSGTSSGSTQSMNPFLQGLESGAGSAIGGGTGAMAIGGAGAGFGNMSGMDLTQFLKNYNSSNNPVQTSFGKG